MSTAPRTLRCGEQLLLVAKNLWRQGYVRCAEGGSCSCPAALVRGAGKNGYEVLREAGQLTWLSQYRPTSRARRSLSKC